MSIKRRLEVAKALEKFYPSGFFESVHEESSEVNDPVTTEEESEILDYSSMSVSELKEHAKEKEIPKYYKMKKSDLIEALNGLE